MELKPCYETKLGKLYCGDAIDLFEIIPDKSIDMILTDLPFGTTKCSWDVVIPFEPLWNDYERIIKDDGAIVLFSSQPFTSLLITSNLKLYRYSWIWEKSKATGFLDAKKRPLKAHEEILVFSKKRTRYFPQKSNGTCYDKGIRKEQTTDDIYNHFKRQHIRNIDGTRYPRSVIYFKTAESEDKVVHKTQKPLSLVEYLIKTYTNEGDMVHDSCMGSGTSAVACENFQRRWIGFEISKEYCEHAKKRISKYQTTESTSILNTEIL